MLRVVHCDSIDPYHNLAMEECLFNSVEETRDVILFLWQNDNTIVIGRNQNAFTECNVALAHSWKCRIARRLTGGGAVYHDLGNLNYTIIVPRALYDIARSAGVIEKAVGSLGIEAARSGRNDILVADRKFSGNAYYSSVLAGMHHGTIMVNVNLQRMERLLNVPGAKISGKGIRSVKSRVLNLIDIRPSMTCQMVAGAIEQAFLTEYADLGAIRYGLREEETQRADALRQKYASRAWRLEQVREYSFKEQRRYPWGSAALTFDLDEGRIKHVSLISDSLYPDLIDRFQTLLCQQTTGNSGSLRLRCADEIERTIVNDLIDLYERALRQIQDGYGDHENDAL